MTYAFDRRDRHSDPHIAIWRSVAYLLLEDAAPTMVAVPRRQENSHL
jgi:hypothetical protein